MKDEIGFADFEALLEALAPRPRRTPPNWEQRERARKTKRRRARRLRREKARAEKEAQRAAKVTPAGRARVGAALAKVAAGGPGRWLGILRFMEPGKAYKVAELAEPVGLTAKTIGLTVTRDLRRRGYVDRVSGGYASTYTITELGLRMARGEIAPNKRGRPRRPTV